MLFVGKQRQMIGMRETRQFFVSREGQFVEVENPVAPRIDANFSGFVTINQVADILERFAVGQIEESTFTFAYDQVINFREMFKDGRTERRDMNIAKNNPDVRTFRTDIGGNFESVRRPPVFSSSRL